MHIINMIEKPGSQNYVTESYTLETLKNKPFTNFTFKSSHTSRFSCTKYTGAANVININKGSE